MNEFNYDREYGMQYSKTSAVAQSTLMKNVYLWMTGALTITGLVAYYVAHDYDILSLIFSSKAVFWTLIIAEFGLVIGLNAAINKINALTATIMFLLYSVINGAMLSTVFVVYSQSAISTAFLTTAGTFGAMALYGSVTKRDLSKLGSLCFMALIGLIIAGIVNIFLGNTMVDLAISALGVLIFVGITAYDAQKIKAMLYGAEVNDTTQKIAVLGALSLYLDFINLFLHILRLFARRD